MPGIEFSIKGEKELQSTLKRLETKTQQRAVRGAAVFSMTPVVKTMRKNAPNRTGTIRKAIQKKTKVYRRAGVVTVLVGVSRGFKTAVGVVKSGPNKGRVIYEDPAAIAHLIEGGHDIVRAGTLDLDTRPGHHGAKRKGTGKVVGHVPAKPFVKSALAKNTNVVMGRYKTKLRANITKLWEAQISG